ncbi:NHL repeat-containing protein 2 [Galendromus occidentalis]|uniref:NHL repeat-containing protein 2 n=1 Tax=Galendromus occidentalis TaxID=34638 RepID=A0AAJ7L7Z5_9ACAR|nr:NHL repeat-containing protein 2 [Galendromus occidentalis]
MHILPHLRDLETQLPVEDLIVIGVHSAKFENEKLSDNVRHAILRHDIRHPVLNDPEMKLWEMCQIICWPTLMLMGPAGEVLYKFIGEKNVDRLIPYVKIFVEYYKSRNRITNSTPLPLRLMQGESSLTQLRSPGKIALDYTGDTSYYVVSDSANNRILVFDRFSNEVQLIVGTGEAGFLDGAYGICRFSSPQGVCFYDGGIFVADAGNHAIRRVDFSTKCVSTVVGTGKQGVDLVGNLDGNVQEISTPWDVVLYRHSVLIIAMAGSHQIWAYATEDNCRLFDGKVVVEKGHCVCIAGSGREENRNTSYPLRAGFAQPSGLALDTNEKFLFIADSESSSIRVMDMQSGAIKNICGGDLDPTNLFAFGDQDGRALDVKLQHPLGLSWDAQTDKLIVADTYNNKLKIVDARLRTCSTIPDAEDFREPGGLAVDSTRRRVYVADTEKHRIKILDMSKDFAVIKILGPGLTFSSSKNSPKDCIDSTGEPTHRTNFQYYEDWMEVQPDFILKLEPSPAPGETLNEEAPQKCKLQGDDFSLHWQHPDTVKIPARNRLHLVCHFVICNEERKTCESRTKTLDLSFKAVKEGGYSAVVVPLLL